MYFFIIYYYTILEISELKIYFKNCKKVNEKKYKRTKELLFIHPLAKKLIIIYFFFLIKT